MNNGITDTKLRLVKDSDILGVSILAYLEAIPGLFGREDLRLGTLPTIQGYGHLYRHPGKMSGFFNKLKGKAFEYAVVELFNSRREPYYSLIYRGINSVLSTEMGAKVKKVRFDIERSSCSRVARESADAEGLVDVFGRFKTVQDARLSISGAANKYPGLEYKVDVVFCDREAERDHQQLVVLASLKVNRRAFLQLGVRQDFRTFPINLGISIETEKKFRGVMFDQALGAYVVYLPMNNVDSKIYAWERAAKIVDRALIEGKRNRMLQLLRISSWPGTAESRWVRFLADRLQANPIDVAQEIREILRPTEKISIAQTILGPKEDTVLELVTL